MINMLKQKWTVARKLTKSERIILWNEFFQTCIRDDFKEKFKTEVFKKRITGRFFNKQKTVNPGTFVHTVLHAKPESLFSVNRINFMPEKEDGAWRLQGRNLVIEDIFFEDYVTIAKAICGNKEQFFFMDDYTGLIYLVGGID